MSRRQRGGGTPISLFSFQDIISCVMGIMLLLTLIMSLQVTVSLSSQASSPNMKRLMDSMEAEASRLEMAIAETEASVFAQTSLLRSDALLDSDILTESITQIQNEVQNAEAELQRLNLLKAASEHDLLESRAESQKRTTNAMQIEQLKNDNFNLEAEIKDLASGQRIIYNAHDSPSPNCWMIELTSPSDIRSAIIGSEHEMATFTDVNALLSWLRSQANTGDAFMLLVKPDAATVFDQVTDFLRQSKSSYGFDLLPQDTAVLTGNPGVK